MGEAYPSNGGDGAVIATALAFLPFGSYGLMVLGVPIFNEVTHVFSQ
jgi:hypothetical protein